MSNTALTHFYAIKTRMYNHMEKGFTHQASMDLRELKGEVIYLSEKGLDVSEIKISNGEIDYLKSKGVKELND